MRRNKLASSRSTLSHCRTPRIFTNCFLRAFNAVLDEDRASHGARADGTNMVAEETLEVDPDNAFQDDIDAMISNASQITTAASTTPEQQSEEPNQALEDGTNNGVAGPSSDGSSTEDGN